MPAEPQSTDLRGEPPTGFAPKGGPSARQHSPTSGVLRPVAALTRAWGRLSPRAQALTGFGTFCAASAVLVAVNGLILSREAVFIWLMIGLLSVSIADVRGWARGVIFDWLPFFAALLAYDVLRGLVGSNPLFEPHVMPQIRVDEILFGGAVPTVELQERFYHVRHIHPWDIAAWAVYLTHFVGALAVAGVLWRVARPQFLRFRAMILTLTAAAFATYLLFPAAPPWMASDDGVIGKVHRVVKGVWDAIGVERAAAIWHRGSAFANEVAALPSLHAAYPFLFLCFFWSRGGWVRAICLAYGLAMGATLVYTGEHYVSDVLLGWVYAIVTYLGVSRLLAWRERRASRRLAGLAPPPLWSSPD